MSSQKHNWFILLKINYNKLKLIICRPHFFTNQRFLVFFIIIVLLAFIKESGSIFSEGGDVSREAPCMDMWRPSVARPWWWVKMTHLLSDAQ